MTTDKAILDAILRNDLQGFIEKTFNTVVPGQTYLTGMLSPLRPYNAENAGQEDGRSETFRCRSRNTGSCAACRRRFSPGLHRPRQ